MALQAFDSLGAVFDKIGILNNLGGLAILLADWAAANMLCTESRELARELGDQRGEQNDLLNLGLISMQIDDLDGAGCYSKAAWDLAQSLSNRSTRWILYRRRFKLAILQGIHRIVDWSKAFATQ